MKTVSGRFLPLLASAFLLLATVSLRGVPAGEFEVRKLADGVYGFIWTDPLADPIEGNSLFVVNDHDVLVVDAGLFPSSTRLMVAELQKITPKPVRYVVNTHFHDDHNNGNFVYREIWPGVEFIAQRDTREDILEKVIRARPDDIRGLKENFDRYTRWLAEGRDDNGKALDSARTKRVEAVRDLYERSAREYATVKDAPPELTFTDSLVLRMGARTVILLWLGRGNTRGDAVIYLPAEGIAAIGDLLVYPVPFAFGSYFREWIATLGRLDSLPAGILFPGHGQPYTDREYLHRVRGLLSGLVAGVDSAVASGAGLEETVKRVTLPAWREKFAMGDARKEAAFDQFFLAPAVERAWHQARYDAEGQ